MKVHGSYANVVSNPFNFCVISPPCTSSKWVGHLPATSGYGYPQCTNPLAANVAPPFLILYYENSNATRQEALYSLEFLHIDVAHLWLVQGTGQRGKREPLVVSLSTPISQVCLENLQNDQLPFLVT